MDRISDAELAEFKEVFSLFDRDGDGTIDNSELKAVMVSLGTNPTDQEVADLVKKVDTDQNGTIDFEEFCAMMSERQQKVDPIKEAAAVLRALDKDKDGRVSREDLIESCRAVHWGNDRPPTEADIDAMMRMAQPDVPDGEDIFLDVEDLMLATQVR
jgi:calmodulin